MKRVILGLATMAAFCLGSVYAVLEQQVELPAPVVVGAAIAPPTAKPVVDHTPPLHPVQVQGYSGTAIIRATPELDEKLNGKPAPAPAPLAAPLPSNLPGWKQPATEAQFAAVAQALARSPRYADALQRLLQLGQGRTGIEEPDPRQPGQTRYVYETGFQRAPEKLAPHLFAAFDAARGVARQNIIFQAALCLPESTYRPWLKGIAGGGDAADAEDANCALAFSGDEAAGAAFAGGALVDCNLLCDDASQHDLLADQGKREILRSYRCIELLDCRPYFWRHCWDCGRGAECPFPWADRRHLDTFEQRNDLARKLLPQWLKRFAGHPGSDDMAWRLCQDCKARQQWFGAAQWASRCATMPDQDMCSDGLTDLITITERELVPSDLDALVAGDDWQRNRQLIGYIKLRRLAAEHGFARALREAETVRSTEPESLIARCFAARWCVAAPKGLGSGVSPLPASDVLHRVEPGAIPAQQFMNPRTYWSNWYIMTNRGFLADQRRLHPPAEALALPGERLTQQFRCWETLAELERRRDATGGDERADLSYKIGAVYYHQRFVVYPCYATEGYNNGLPTGLTPRGHQPTIAETLVRAEYASYVRAAREFEQIADYYPGWAGRDKALYSAALAHIKLVDYQPFWGFANQDIRAAVELFDRLKRDHPQSELSKGAAMAADYWRRMRPTLFSPVVSLEE